MHSRNHFLRSSQRRFWRHAPLALSLPLIALSACFCEPADPELQGPEAPIASVIVVIEGVVTDALTGQPVPGADVHIPAAGDRGKVKTNDDGFYSVRFEGFGSFNVFISKDGYAKGKSVANTSSSNAPEASYIINVVQNPTLYPTIGSVRGVVAGSGPLDAIGNARVLVRVNNSQIFDPGLVLETTTGEDGRYELTGLPAGASNLRLLVPGQDLDEDGEPDFATKLVSLGTLDEAPTVVNVAVAPFTADAVVWTSFDNVENFAIEPDVSFEFVFAGPMSTTPGATEVTLRRGGTAVSTTHSWDDEGLVLTVTPRVPLMVGKSYDLRVDATSVANQTVSWGTYTFTVGGDRVPGEVENVTLVSDPTTLPFFQPWIEVGFDPVADATGYRVYARNDRTQTDWLQITQAFTSNLDPVAPTIGFTLPSAFNSVPGVATPFGLGETVEVAVVALLGGNEGPFPAVPLDVRDEACLDLSVSVSGVFNNTAGTAPSDVLIRVSAVGGEWLDEAAAPTVSFSNYVFPDGDDFTFAASDFTATWTDDDTVELNGQVPAGMSAILDEYTVDLSALRDPSGNGPCEGEETVSGLIGDSGHHTPTWSMEADDGWSGDGEWERGAPSNVGPTDPPDGDNLWGTVLDGPYSDDAVTTSTLSSPTLVLPSSSGQLTWYYWFEGNETLALYWVEDGGSEWLLRNLTPNGYWGYDSVSLSSYAGQTGHFEWRFTTNGDGETVAPGAGAYLDQVGLAGYWYYNP